MARRDTGPLKLYDFTTVDQLLIGWQTHALRQTKIHTESARRLAQSHWWLGVPAAVTTGIAGTLATIGTQTSVGWWGIAAGVLALLAAILVSVQTFLDLGGRAERHRQAATAYKRTIRQFELWPPDPTPLRDLWEGKTATREDLEKLQGDLAQADADAPIPPRRLSELYEDKPMDIRDRVEKADEDG